jgi:3-methyl-2-oxobutanoate hydroxymethyltransferase
VFSEDILGEGKTRVPRHAKAYRNFAAEYERLQKERISAYSEFIADVKRGAFPEEKHVIKMAPEELAEFKKRLDSE